MSAASSACDHIYNWINGTPKDTWVSMGVYSDGSYNAPKVSLSLLAYMRSLTSLLTFLLTQPVAQSIPDKFVPLFLYAL